MKTLQNLLLTAFLTMAIVQTNASAQTNATLYVIFQHTDESASYNENFATLQNEIMNKYASYANIAFISFNLSNDNITANTKGEFDWYTVYNTSFANNGQEGIIIMDALSKDVIARYNLDAGTKDILKSIAEGSQLVARANQ